VSAADGAHPGDPAAQFKLSVQRAPPGQLYQRAVVEPAADKTLGSEVKAEIL
jgi:hypothetical protein